MRVLKGRKAHTVGFVSVNKKYFTITSICARIDVVSCIAAWLFWLRYRKLLHVRGYRFREFRLRCTDFVDDILRPKEAVSGGFERREIRARW